MYKFRQISEMKNRFLKKYSSKKMLCETTGKLSFGEVGVAEEWSAYLEAITFWKPSLDPKHWYY